MEQPSGGAHCFALNGASMFGPLCLVLGAGATAGAGQIGLLLAMKVQIQVSLLFGVGGLLQGLQAEQRRHHHSPKYLILPPLVQLLYPLMMVVVPLPLMVVVPLEDLVMLG